MKIRTILFLVVLAVAYTVSFIRFSTRDIGETAETTLIIAHAIPDRNVEAAFDAVARRYEALHDGKIKVKITSVPPRIYTQWLRTQLIGDTAPDAVQFLGTAGDWALLAQAYLIPLTGFVNAPNPYNADTELAAAPWRETFRNDMDSGYSTHLLDYYLVPFSVSHERLIFNAELLAQIWPEPLPPHTLADWFHLCDLVDARRAETGRPLYPLAITAEQRFALYEEYFPVHTADLMEDSDYWHTGHNQDDFIYYGMKSGTFDVKQARILQRTQPTKDTDKSQDVLMHFTQGRALAMLGTPADLAALRTLADFDTVLAPMPQPETPDWRESGAYSATAYESTRFSKDQFSFGVTQGPRLAQTLDFLRYCTSQEANETFCAALSWAPIIKGAQPRSPDLNVFYPVTDGAAVDLPWLESRAGPTSVFFRQFLPLYINGNLTADEFLDRLATTWDREFLGGMQVRMNQRALDRRHREFSVARAKAEMLFPEARSAAGAAIVGTKGRYPLALENAINDPRISAVHQAILSGDFRLPAYQHPDVIRAAAAQLASPVSTPPSP